MKNLFFFLLLNTLSVYLGFSQTTISGKLLDVQNRPISNVSVTYKKVGDAALLGFGRSDNNGLFRLIIKVTDIDSVQLDFQHMNYAKKSGADLGGVFGAKTDNLSFGFQTEAWW